MPPAPHLIATSRLRTSLRPAAARPQPACSTLLDPAAAPGTPARPRMCALHERRTPLVRARFTLIELLVVVAIIAVLAAMLLPAMSRARERGRSAVCNSNVRQIGMAMVQYTTDNDGMIPTAYNWRYEEVPRTLFGQPLWSAVGLGYYVDQTIFYACPSADWAGQVGTTKTTYGMNDNFQGGAWPPKPPKWRLERIRGDLTKKLVFIDSGHNNDLYQARMFRPGSGAWEQRKYGWDRHNMRPNFVALDGHAESLPFENLDVVSGNNDWWRISAP